MKQQIFYNKTINKKELKSIVHSTFQSYGIIKATNLAESLKKNGFSFATKAGISISIEDLKVPPTKNSLFLKNNEQINLVYFYEKRGNINEIERFQKVIDTWHTTSEILKNQLVDFFKSVDPFNPVYMMAFSGARGNLSQVRQLVGMRGLMSDPKGQIIDLPIKANFREGLSITDYVISSYGARKGIVDTALRTADSGYLTRRLVDVAQHVIIRELDCKTKNGVRVSYDSTKHQVSRYLGRVLARSVRHPISGEVILKRNAVLTAPNLNKIDFVTNFVLRSPLICESSNSICQKCYGWNLSQGNLVELADAVGVIAAQSIGEPGTQLTMRTFHTGGVFTGESSNQIHSSVDGQILFSPDLKTSTSRTIYGEVILKALNSSEFYLFDTVKKTLQRHVIVPEMLLFVPNKSFIKKGDVLAEFPLGNKRTTTQLKDIFVPLSGEVQFQNILSDRKNTLINNGLIWIAKADIYDISTAMLLKQPGTQVVKNNAIAQTKIVTPIGGIVKYSQKIKNSNNYIVTSPSIFLKQSLFRTVDNELFLLGKKGSVLTLELYEDSVVANYRTNKFLFLKTYDFYSGFKNTIEGGQINKFTALLFFPLRLDSSLIEKSNADLYIEVTNTIENQQWNNKIVYPGEKICDAIYVLKLSYCQLEIVDKQKIRVTLLPLKQGIIPKPNNLLNQFLNSSNRDFNATHSSFNCVSNSKIVGGKSFLDVSFNFSFGSATQFSTQDARLKFLKVASSEEKRLGFFNIYRLPSKIKASKNQTTFMSYLIRPNQIIQPYSIIARANIISSATLKIKNLKNYEKSPNRFLISTCKDYKEVPHSSIKTRKFIVVGDKLQTGELSDYSGYILSEQKKLNSQIRLSSPFFVSQGTRLLVQHGSLIKSGESLCQLVYKRVISDDIVTGLPRIEQLLEGRLEKNPCDLIEQPGVIKDINTRLGIVTVIEKTITRNYQLNVSMTSLFKKGELVSVAQPLDSRLINAHQVLKTYFQYYCALYSIEKATKRSITAIQIIVLNLVQDVYRSQGIYISDKHVEIIVRQITSKVRILKSNNQTAFTVGEVVEFQQVLYINRALRLSQTPLIEYEPVLLGITKVSLMTESFISAASFQETTRILTQAAVEGKVEWLRGLKENVILGRLIPAGTGFKAFNSTPMLNIRLD
jgi:DNA-directed RNA polymerase subunit beta'